MESGICDKLAKIPFNFDLGLLQMLVEFGVSNFRSILTRQALSMAASASNEMSEANVLPSEQSGLRCLRSAVIYGPNAAGKSNLFQAAQFAQQFIIGSAVQAQEGNGISVAPFALSSASKNTASEFDFVFVEGDVRYQYGFGVDTSKVTYEWLTAFPNGRAQRWFQREFNTETGSYDWNLGPNFRGERNQRSTWRNSTRSNALFLSTAVQLNNEQLRPVFSWFQNKLGVVTATNSMNLNLSMQVLKDPERKESLNHFMRAADVGIEGLDFIEDDGPSALFNINIFQGLQGLSPLMMPGQLPTSSTVISNFGPGITRAPNIQNLPKPGRVLASHREYDSDAVAQFDLFSEESEGTRKLFQFAGGWIKALSEGATLLVDELDRSLHPLMTRFLISMFHDRKSNTGGAQLIFTTHDTTLLDTQLFRRDQIWFMEKDKNSSSHLYPLLQFSPRKDEALERGYLRGRYGAVPFIIPASLHV